MRAATSKLAPKGPLQHSREERVQLGGGLRLVALEGVELGLQAVKVFDDMTLFCERGHINFYFANMFNINMMTCCPCHSRKHLFTKYWLRHKL